MTSSPRIADGWGYWHAEWMCLRQVWRSTRRHRRYAVAALILYGKSLGQWRAMRIHRLGFAALQGLDDVLDGDRLIEIEPMDLANDICKAIEGRDFDRSEWGVLFGSLLDSLDAISPDGEGCHELVALIHTMVLDRKRVKEHAILPRDGLFAQLRATFVHALNLSLIATGSRIRAHDVPEMVEMLSWCSLVRDLPEDWRKDLINVPVEILNQTNLQGRHFAYTPSILKWLRQEYFAVEPSFNVVENFTERLGNFASDPGLPMLRLYARALKRYRKRYSLPDDGAADSPVSQAAHQSVPNQRLVHSVQDRSTIVCERHGE